MKYLILTFVLLLNGCLLLAQVYNYFTFQPSTGTYTEITGTSIPDIEVDDALSGAIPIGFTFNYAEDSYTNVKVSSNGWIGLGELATENNNLNGLSDPTSFPIIAPLWDDISLGEGSCKYLTSGTAPNRMFIVQYQNVKWNYFANNQFNFQVKLYETGKIEFVYGSSTGLPSEATASIGISINPGGVQNFFSVTPGAMASVSFNNENAIISTFPGVGVIFTFDVRVPVPNDLAAITLSGNSTPSAGSLSNYNVNIRNFGTVLQNNYTISLMSGANVLATIAGTPIAQSASLDIIVPWTPQTVGEMAIYAKVNLPGDAFPQNDTSPPLIVDVQPAGTTVVTIGSGNQYANIPVNMYWKNSLSETIYLSSEIVNGGLINQISFYNHFVSNLTQKPTKIWLGATQLSDLSAGWIPSSELMLVFDGNVDYPSGENRITIPLTAPFISSGSNLVIMVQRPMDTRFYDSLDQFQCQTGFINRTRYAYSDIIMLYPDNPPIEAELTGQFPQISLYFAAIPPIPEFTVSPSIKNFGTLLMNSTASQLFTIYNSGSGTLGINNISISGSPFFTLQNLPTLPNTLASLASCNFTASYNPTAAGNHSATISITDNLNRVIHTVQLSGFCMDPTIYTSPYFQNFDSVMAPNLPLDWNNIYSPPVMWGELQTDSNNFHSFHNSVSMYNSESQTVDMLLISPPIGPDMNLPAMRVKFWAKGNAGTTLQVGVIADIGDVATYSSVSTINLSRNWEEYIVSFQTYAGFGRFIAFKHGNSHMFNNIYIDDVTIENTPQNDLAALSISGNNTPAVNSATTYTVTIFNGGTNPQSDYSVKLYQAGGMELASVPGPTINPGSQAIATLSWTPTVPGNSNIYGKVVLISDQNNLNDQTINLNVLVIPPGTSAVTIGTGNQQTNIPVAMSNLNSLYETVFSADHITSGGYITEIAFYNNFVDNLTQKPTKIWLGVTDQNNLSAGWIPSTQLTLVYDGLVDYPSGSNMIVIHFATPYLYIGTNIVMMVYRPMDTETYSYMDNFYTQTMGTNTSLSVSSDWDTFNPANPPAEWFNLSGQSPKTTLFFIPATPNPLFGVTPAAKNFGSVLLNSNNLQVFTVFNSGGAPLTVNSISLSGNQMYSLNNLPNLPMTLNSGQSLTFNALYHPTEAGNHTAIILITDNQLRARTPHSVSLEALCVDPTIYTSPYTQNFDAAITPSLPIDWQLIHQSFDANSYIQTSSNNSFSNPNSVEMYNGEDDAATIMLIAPPLAVNLPTVSMRVKFKVFSWGDVLLETGVITNPSDPSTFQSVSTITASNNWAEHIISFQTYNGTGQYIAFKLGEGDVFRNLFMDDVMIETIPQNDLEAVSILGNALPSVSMATIYTIDLFNWGINPQSNYTVKLYKEGDIEIASVEGTLINSGSSAQVELSWTPSIPETTYIYGKVLLTSDQNNLNDQTANLNVIVQPAGTIVVTVGDGTDDARMPLDMYYHNSLFETIYLSSELNMVGLITGISFYNDFVTDLSNKPTNIWLGTTTQNDLSSDWIPSTVLTQVFSGTVNYPHGENVVTITFTEPYLFTQGNLVMMAERPMDGAFYDQEDNFHCQTIGFSRTRNIYSDFTDYDPANPPEDEVEISGQFPQTSFMFIGGLANLEGHVYGFGNIPLNNATVQIVGGTSVITDSLGFYHIQNVIAGTYQVTVSRLGYNSQTLTVAINEDETTVQNFNLIRMPIVNVSGIIVGNDVPTGLSGTNISLTGYGDYNAITDTQGQFTISEVFANQTYQYAISHLGYQIATGTLIIGTTNYNMGTITINEIPYSPRGVHAVLNVENTEVAINWLAPDPNAVDIDQSFEGTSFPPTDWSQIITNSGPAGTNGVFPTWCRVGTVVDGTTTITPVDGSFQCGLWLDYNYQDEWLITPQFNCPQSAFLNFGTYVFRGSNNGDHYYVKISNNDGNNWTVLWDASALTGGIENYQTPVVIDLSAYAGQQVKIAWHADDNNSEGMWHSWFIDNVIISNSITTLRFSEEELLGDTQTLKRQSGVENSQDRRSNYVTREANQISFRVSQNTHRQRRSLIGYKVWRLTVGQEQNEATWTSLTPNSITSLSFVDNGWITTTGSIKWAVKAVYSGNVLSPAVFSNAISHGTPPGTLAGYVRNAQNQPIAGATITAGPFTTTTSADGNYSMSLWSGTYTVTCSKPGFFTLSQDNVLITASHTTNLNFVFGVANEDEIQVTVTTLKGNYPNPFNPSTTINYDVKNPVPVRIEIYNTKGQLIRILVNEFKSNGHHQIVWNGEDENGKPVASGIYHYRMQAGAFKAIHKMMLLK